MKILLIAGHGGSNPYDCGAVGNGYKEANLTREMLRLIASELHQFASICIYDQSRNAYRDVKSGKFKIDSDIDYALEIHFNSASKDSANGTEIYVTQSEKGTSVEEKIISNLGKFFVNRGVKRNDFAVIKNIKKKGISSALLEVCFINNKKDMTIYQSCKEQIAKGIADGIVEGFGLKKTNVSTVVKHFPKADQDETSIVDYLREKCGYKVQSFSDRQKIAEANGIKPYRGTYEQNIKVLEIAKQGKLIKP